MKPLFIITARGGSKGIPGKNIKPLFGKPLINYSIDLARQFVTDKFICVSTDSEAIANVANDNGLDVPFIRPVDLATDNAGSYEVIKHALKYYENKLNFDRVVLFQPTSPFRLKKHVSECLTSYNDRNDMLVSVKVTKANPYQLLYSENSDGYIEKVIKGNEFERRQDLPKVYQINGAIYIYNPKALFEKEIKDFSKIKHYEMPELNSVDIDEPLDWAWAEFLLQNRIVTFDYE